MTVVPFGGKPLPVAPPTIDLAPVLAALKDQIVAEVMASVVGQLGPPNVTVAAPVVSVQAPNVTVPQVVVPPAQVTVAPDVTVDLSPLTRALAEVQAAVVMLIAEERKPVHKKVVRDQTGRIVSVEETRG